MKTIAYGGFGEKGRTSIALEHSGFSLLLDCGVNTSDRATYYPAITPDELAACDAMLITHAHEDHVGAVGWAIANGFRGRLLMTRETRAEATAIWQAYSSDAECRLASAYPCEEVPSRGEMSIGPFRVETGRSGHIVGGSGAMLRRRADQRSIAVTLFPEARFSPSTPCREPIS